jgi:NADPH-dependent curcumin reductase
MRIWMAADSYLPAVAIGEVMRSFGFAEVVESRHPDYRKGDRVTGFTGLQDYLVVESARQSFQKAPKIPFVSDTVFLGLLGVNGLTAFFGMEIAAPKKGETMVVSAAAGPNRQHCRSDWKDPRLPRRGHCRIGRQMQLAYERPRF